MTRRDEKSLAQLVGARIRSLRSEAGARQEDVANAGRAYGLRWSRSSVAQLEAGTLDVSALTLLLLPMIIGDVIGRPVHLAELVDSVEPMWVTVGPESRIDIEPLNTIARGEGSDTAVLMLHEVDTPATRAALSRNAEAAAGLRELRDRLWPKARLTDIAAAIAVVGEAEQKAARRWDVPVSWVAVAAFRVWGMGLAAKRDEVVAELEPEASPRRAQALRGHITRRLLDELTAVVEEAR